MTTRANEEVLNRVARFSELRPISNQVDPNIPQAALDIIYSRKLLPVIGLERNAQTALANDAPIQGAGGITMTFAVCPPNQGPDLHAHKRTYETFTVLQGEFEFRWGDAGENVVLLKQFDVLSFPPGVARAFRNVSDVEGIVQVIITGGVHDMNDVVLPAQVARAVQEASPYLYEKIAKAGISFAE